MLVLNNTVCSQVSAKFEKPTGHNLITIVGICMQIFPMPCESVLIFHYPLCKKQKHNKSKMQEYKKDARKMLPVSEAVTGIENRNNKNYKDNKYLNSCASYPAL